MEKHHKGFTITFFDCSWDELPKMKKEGLNVTDAAALLVQWMLDTRREANGMDAGDHVNLGAHLVTIEETL